MPAHDDLPRDDVRGAIGPPLTGVSEVEVDGRICLYSPKGEQVLVLNDTASDVWRLVDGELTAEGIISRLAAAYDTESGRIDEEVRAVLAQFRDCQVLPSDDSP